MKLNKNYWQERYENQETSWDVGRITTPLKEYCDQLTDKTLKILIPGGGNSYEFEYLIQEGFTNVWVLDYAPTPLENIKKRLPNTFESQLLLGDFFDHDGQYDLIIEQTFFCALDPTLRQAYAEKMPKLLSPKGKLVGLLFQFPLTEEGPPFGGSIEEYQNLFSDHFGIKTLETAHNSIKPREDRELFFVFEKK
ncbi:methyltransferase domain-containing protein [Flavobacterium sp. SUN046]|uniref:methyltransferase domain-containing protein n=1 Tax=Flavobacterium sp. SUN046 TaxID=3002440 RepID=UPI002DBD6A83|nr:methyltransferase domain-containing protein [Flavobacterium sp. SUN046]MEC4048817.1 methyltransferase domain-containing protein [Flavobacterium sp. SUN046]